VLWHEGRCLLAGDDRAGWADAERKYHNDRADSYVAELERGHIFHLADDGLLYRYLPEGPEPAVILDAGCGPSISVRKYLAPHLRPSDKYIGVDIAERMLQVARDNVPRGTFVREDVQRLRLRPESVDAVLCLGALHHAPEPLPVLRELLQSVRPGGLLLLREPTSRAFRRGQGESPAEEGLDVAVVKSELARSGAAILSETYLTSWLFIHARHRLQVMGLSAWERWPWPWLLKLGAEVLLERITGGHLPRYLKGLDMWMVVRKAGARERTGDGSLEAVLACPACGARLQADGRDFKCSACGNRLAIGDGLWSFGG
jgi:SAM-dependent methyltransferase